MAAKRSKPEACVSAPAPSPVAVPKTAAARPDVRSAVTLIGAALVIGVLAGFVTMLMVDILLPWSTPINVPALPLENWQAMSASERESMLRSGAVKIREIEGFEKAQYVLRAAPVQLRNDWISYALPSIAAALVCGWFVRRRRNP